jgi:hypothetical protein
LAAEYLIRNDKNFASAEDVANKNLAKDKGDNYSNGGASSKDMHRIATMIDQHLQSDELQLSTKQLRQQIYELRKEVDIRRSDLVRHQMETDKMTKRFMAEKELLE